MEMRGSTIESFGRIQRAPMKSRRLRSIHVRFLEASRTLRDNVDYWKRSGTFLQKALSILVPVPLLSLTELGQGLLNALEHLESVCKSTPLSEQMLAAYHRLVLPGSTSAGTYRRGVPIMPDNPLKPPSPQKVPLLMKGLEERLRTGQGELDREPQPSEDRVLTVALDVYQRIGTIHPFSDGNGRVARLALNHLMRRYSLGYVILPALSDSKEHWDALLEAGRGNPERLLEFSRTCIMRV